MYNIWTDTVVSTTVSVQILTEVVHPSLYDSDFLVIFWFLEDRRTIDWF